MSAPICCPLCGYECEDALDLRQHVGMRHEFEIKQRLANWDDRVIAELRELASMPRLRTPGPWIADEIKEEQAQEDRADERMGKE